MNTHTNVVQLALVESIKRGEFVRKIKVCDKCNGDGATDRGPCDVCDTHGYTVYLKTYTRGDYDRATKRYSLIDTEDFCREVFVKKGTRLLVGFTY